MEEPLKTAKEGLGLVGEIIKLAGDNPDAKKAGQNLARTAATLTQTINTALLPLAAVNFAFDRARTYFEEHFRSDITAKTEAIPNENLVEPKASLAGPALQGLAFTHEEENLREMYLNLLASAMDNRVASDAHPAFVEIVKQLEAQEAEFLASVLRVQGVAIAELRQKIPNRDGWDELQTHLLNPRDSSHGHPVEIARLPAMIDNWIRLGLVVVDYNKHLLGETEYAWVEKRPEYLRFKEKAEANGGSIVIQKGLLARSSLGKQFAKVVGLVGR